MDIAYIYKTRLIIQDEEFSYEFFTSIFPELLWDDYDKAMEFVKKLALLHHNIVTMFNDEEISEKRLYFTCVNRKVVFTSLNKEINHKTIDNYNLNFLNKLKS